MMQWQNGRRGQDGWGRWTRRRKWYRDAELVEVDDDETQELEAGALTPSASTSALTAAVKHDKTLSPVRSEPALPLLDQTTADNRPTTSDSNASRAADDALSLQSTSSRSWGFGSLRRRPAADRSSIDTKGDKERKRRPSEVMSDVLSEEGEDQVSGLGTEVEMELQKQGKEGGTWGIGDEARMSLE